MDRKSINVETIVNAPLSKVWEYWTMPEHIDQWNFASPDWQSTDSKSELRTGGTFSSIMSAKDGSASFEFGGTFTNVVPEELIEYELGDGRKVSISFKETPDGVIVSETFELEDQNTEELQRSGWQAILDNFKKHTETK